ncbi:uncharacterized protein [Triticum aestivum]|nr:uncharacterized protein LOC123137356 isoform X2 [Triticum aestivum]
MADGSSAMATSFVNVLIDDGLLIKNLPPLSPIHVTISKQFILERAIETIGGTLHPFTFTGTSSDDVDVSLSIDLPPHSKSMSSTRKEFHAPHIESTCVAALAYLQKTGIVTIDDANFAELKICKRELQAEEFWSSTLYDKANALGNQLSLLTAAKQKPQPEDKQGAAVLPPNHHNTPQTRQKVLSEHATGRETTSTPVTETNNRFVRGSPYEVHRQAGWITAPISMLSDNDSLVDNVYYVLALITFSYVFSLLVLNLMSNGYLLWSCKRTKFDSAL